MKKNNPDRPRSPNNKGGTIDTPKLSATTEALFSKRLRNPTQVSHMFTILPNVDNESILCHACENLASLNVMATDLAGELQRSQRNIALAIQQFAVLCELAVNRALDNLDPPQGFA
ncbi:MULTISPECIES: DUF6124 family protein [unclassified Pseudomonas]|uniref:DUF6124 family protein n=1 Tax=unclassified Pseudomonas TaxID=196821 RepID=UPI0030DDA3CF